MTARAPHAAKLPPKIIVKKIFVTYAFVCDGDGRLVGIVTMRDLLVSDGHQTLSDIMLKNPFFLSPDTPLMDAMKLVLNRHFPIYPVCDGKGNDNPRALVPSKASAPG